VQNLSLLHEAVEGADFPKLGADPVGVAGGVAKIKVDYNPDGIPVACMTCACLVPFGSDAQTKKSDLFLMYTVNHKNVPLSV